MLSKTYTKYIQSLHYKKSRDIHNAFIAEGSKVVMDLLKSPEIVCECILAKPEWLQKNRAMLKGLFKGRIEQIEDFELEKITALSTPNQVLAVFKKLCDVIIDVKDKIVLLLDTIQDPGNLGTIIRIADWFGVAAIICSETCADRYNPKAVQSTMGSIGRVNMLYTNLGEWLKKNSVVTVYAATLNGKDLTAVNGITEGIILIGNESKGISEELIQMAQKKITIPAYGQAESLNAAVATGIILSHINVPKKQA